MGIKNMSEKGKIEEVSGAVQRSCLRKRFPGDNASQWAPVLAAFGPPKMFPDPFLVQQNRVVFFTCFGVRWPFGAFAFTTYNVRLRHVNETKVGMAQFDRFQKQFAFPLLPMFLADVCCRVASKSAPITRANWKIKPTSTRRTSTSRKVLGLTQQDPGQGMSCQQTHMYLSRWLFLRACFHAKHMVERKVPPCFPRVECNNTATNGQ